MLNFNVKASDKVALETILISPLLALELELIEGQYLQLQGNDKVVLKSQFALDIPPEENETSVAWIHPQHFVVLGAEAPRLKVLEITVGCDPEYFILNNKAIVSAASYLPFQGEIGCDGTLAELRPHYGKHESEVVGNLRKLIPQIPSRLGSNKWAGPKKPFSYEAHSYYSGFPAGFHIHLGLPPEVLNTRTEFNRTTLNYLVRALDWLVSVPLLPLEVAHERRLGRGKYGKPGDYRPSAITLEYRTPGAFYLRTPALAQGLMGMCLAITEDLLTKVKQVSNNYVKLDKVTVADLNNILPIPEPSDILKLLGTREPEQARSKLEDIYSRLSKLSSFSLHKESIEGFFRVVENKERPSPFLLTNWKE